MKKFIKKIIKIIKKPQMRILPANLAFYLVLSLIPIASLILFFASKFSVSFDILTDFLTSIVPREVTNIITGSIRATSFTNQIGFFNIAALVVASNGMYAIINVSNNLYDIKDHDIIRARIKSFLLLLIVISLFIFLIIVPILGNKIIVWLQISHVSSDITNNLLYVFNLIKWPLTCFVVFFGIRLIYVVAPDEKILSSSATLGALFTTFIWIIASFIFSIYLQNFAKYDALYGNLSSIIILMIWIYILAYIFVLGIAINASMYKKEEEE